MNPKADFPVPTLAVRTEPVQQRSTERITSLLDAAAHLIDQNGIDGLTTFPFGAPHVHFNVWLDGEYVDPFAAPGETSLWRAGNWPVPSSTSRLTM